MQADRRRSSTNRLRSQRKKPAVRPHAGCGRDERETWLPGHLAWLAASAQEGPRRSRRWSSIEQSTFRHLGDRGVRFESTAPTDHQTLDDEHPHGTSDLASLLPRTCPRRRRESSSWPVRWWLRGARGGVVTRRFCSYAGWLSLTASSQRAAGDRGQSTAPSVFVVGL